MDKLKMQSLDVIGSNIEKIQQLFPNCVTERLSKDGKPELAIDFEKLQAELSNEIIAEGEERYQFTWPDKRAANRLANTPTTMTLRPCREESVDFDHTQNLYIEGDNLDVLKALRETYLGKVKMIYIDPPYNTGNDFVYNDDFAQSRDEFEEISGLFDEEGNQTIDPMQRNTESNGRFHTDWLNMIYPRLKVARDLLSDDGVIFISIDDNEVENLKKICCEIFGSNNFLTCVTRSTGTPTGGGFDGLVNELDYILIFAKNISCAKIHGLPMSEQDSAIYDQKDEKGRYLTRSLRRTGGEDRREDRPTMYYGLTAPDGTIVYPIGPTGYDSRWICGFQKYLELESHGLVEWKKNKEGKWLPYQKFYLENRTKAPGNLWIDIDGNKKATRDIRTLFDTEKVFDFPKPVGVLNKIITIGTDQDSIVLDFFSGSATTAHAVMQLNAEDGGNRKFIMVQLPEKTDEKSEAYKAGYKNICEIGKERIRRAGKQIVDDLENTLKAKETHLDKILHAKPSATVQLLLLDQQREIAKNVYENEAVPVINEIEKIKAKIQKLDTGFRVLKLDSSNMEEVYYTPQDFDVHSLFNENVKADRTGEDLLFQVMLDLGIELSAKIETRQIAGKTVHLVDDNYLVACFDRDVTENAIKEIAELHPVYFVMRDASAANDNVIDNFEQIFHHYSPDTNCKIL